MVHINPRIHLLKTPDKAACGLADPRKHSTDPEEVTCGKCQTSVHMFDARVKAGHIDLTPKTA